MRSPGRGASRRAGRGRGGILDPPLALIEPRQGSHLRRTPAGATTRWAAHRRPAPGPRRASSSGPGARRADGRPRWRSSPRRRKPRPAGRAAIRARVAGPGRPALIRARLAQDRVDHARRRLAARAQRPGQVDRRTHDAVAGAPSSSISTTARRSTSAIWGAGLRFHEGVDHHVRATLMAQRLGRQPGRPGLFGNRQRAQAAGLVRQGPPVANALDQSQCALARHIAARLCQNAFLCLSDVQHCSATPYAIRRIFP